MDERKWIGIQFNLDDKTDIRPWLAAHSSERLESDGQHFEVRFSPKDLIRLKMGDKSKLEIIKLALREYLAASEFTTIYTYFNAERLKPQQEALLNGLFKDQIEVKEVTSLNSFLRNFQGTLTSGTVRRILKKGPLMAAMDDLLPFVAKRDFGTEQALSLNLGYEIYEEWEGIDDSLCVAIQVKIP